MHFVYFFSYFCLGAMTLLLLLESVNGESPVYDHSYIQAPCDPSGNRELTLGANGFRRYGFIDADNDGCYNPYLTCRIRLSVNSGYQITLRFQWIAIEISDVLIITEAAQTHRIEGNSTPPYSIYSTTNWMNLEFITNTDISNCLGGFRLYYTSFHYGECSENEFRCSVDGRCIPNEVVCDSYDNCGDWSDEMNGTCGGLSTSTVTAVTPPESVNPVYDHSYIQAPCDISGNRELTLGANGFRRYGFIDADNDGCYNPYLTCRIRLSVSSGYQITLRLQWIAIELSDVLIITEAAQTHSMTGYITPSYSIYSTTNWMNLEFVTSPDISNCLGGFRLYYTSFHYGECSENEFRCSLDGRCIPNEVVCDSYDNCGDWSDEMNGTCGGLSTSTVTAVTPPESANPVYDYRYIQAPCDNSRNFTLGANGYQRYGFIEADDDGCYNPHTHCGIILSVSSGCHITLRLQWVAIELSDVLKITEAASTHPISGHIIPVYSIYSTSNWVNLEFITNADINNCLGGFNLYYTSFHYGECSENEFRCSVDGRCIPNEVVCDSYDNCGDWSDEMNGTCGGLSTSTVTIVTPPESVNPVYDHSYIQAPCDISGNRELTLGANGFRRYGFIDADNDGCYNPYLTCRIRLSVSSGYQITLRLQWIAIELSDVLIIIEAAQTHSMTGYITPSYSIYSTTNWMNLEFVTSPDISNCLGGFRLYYTSFHYGECSENEFRCSLDGRCIPNEVVCDSYDNCGDWSDESSATCGGLSKSVVL